MKQKQQKKIKVIKKKQQKINPGKVKQYKWILTTDIHKLGKK